MNDVMLTTTDNPWNPFTNFDEWYQFDTEKGYHTCSYLDRIVRTSNELSESDQEFARLTAIEEILELNILGIYTTIKEDEDAPKGPLFKPNVD